MDLYTRVELRGLRRLAVGLLLHLWGLLYGVSDLRDLLDSLLHIPDLLYYGAVWSLSSFLCDVKWPQRVMKGMNLVEAH